MSGDGSKPHKPGKKPGKAGETAGPFEALRSMRDDMKKKAQAAGEPPAPPAPKPRRRAAPAAEPRVPEDEALLMHRLFAGVEPLDRSRRGRVSKQPIERSPSLDQAVQRGVARAREEAEAVHEHLRGLVEGRVRFEVSDDGLHVEGRRIDVPSETVRNLRRGRLPIDGRLDLHGMTVAEARA
ncbi:MAG: hypothetical protein FWD17_16205, partial [Polyangiaceae bacterium]|nr:hypothetical protein [Polyangiaceae bacterium]